MTNYHILIVKYIGMTNKLPARVKIISERFNQSVIIPFTNEAGSTTPALDSAVEWLYSKLWTIKGVGEGKGHMYIVAETFAPLKDKH